MKPRFTPGNNIALKVPTHQHEKTVAFYRDTLGFKQINDAGYYDESPRFEFGDKVLSIDAIDGLSQSEIWLQIITSDLKQADDYLKNSDCVRCDEIEPLPDGMKAMWISSPANTIHLFSEGNTLS